jgi:hypothetical protein
MPIEILRQLRLINQNRLIVNKPQKRTGYMYITPIFIKSMKTEFIAVPSVNSLH